MEELSKMRLHVTLELSKWGLHMIQELSKWGLHVTQELSKKSKRTRTDSSKKSLTTTPGCSKNGPCCHWLVFNDPSAPSVHLGTYFFKPHLSTTKKKKKKGTSPTTLYIVVEFCSKLVRHTSYQSDRFSSMTWQYLDVNLTSSTPAVRNGNVMKIMHWWWKNNKTTVPEGIRYT